MSTDPMRNKPPFENRLRTCFSVEFLELSLQYFAEFFGKSRICDICPTMDTNKA